MAPSHPTRVGVVVSDMQVNQVMLPPVMPGHRRQRLPIDSFLVDAEAAPARFVLENLVGKLVDAGSRFARTGVAGDKPTAAELVPPPSQAAKPGDVPFALPWMKQETQGENRE